MTSGIRWSFRSQRAITVTILTGLGMVDRLGGDSFPGPMLSTTIFCGAFVLLSILALSMVLAAIAAVPG